VPVACAALQERRHKRAGVIMTYHDLCGRGVPGSPLHRAGLIPHALLVPQTGTALLS